MKHGLLVMGLFIFTMFPATCQVSKESSKERKWEGGSFCEVSNKRLGFEKSIDLLAGFVPNPDYNALKLDLIACNMLFKRVGFYTSFEVGGDSDYLTNTWGINVSLFRFLYIFGGADLFTSYGLIASLQENNSNSVRKEAGIGLYPFKNFTIRAGYSLEVGMTFTVGYRITLNKKNNNFNLKRNNRTLPAYFRNIN